MANATKKLNHFEDCPNEKERLQGLVKTMKELKKQLDEARKEYKQKVNSCLSRKHPFPTNGIIENDVSQYIKLVGHCLYVGDKEILEEWGIKPIKTSSFLLSSNDFELYAETFEGLAEDSEEALERECYILLKNFFQFLSRS